MTIGTYAKDGPYTGDASAGQAFTITFDFFDTSEIVATTRVTATGVEATLVETTNYTISTTGSDPFTGGTLTLATGTTIAATSTLTISRTTTRNQQTDFVSAGQFPSDDAEDQFDKNAMQIQELQEEVSRCIKIPITDGSTQEDAVELPNAVDRQSTNLVFTATGAATASSLVTPTDTTVSAYGATLVDDANAAAARTTLGSVIGTDVQAYDADLQAISGLTSADNKIVQYTGSGTAKVIDYLDEDAMGSDSAEAVASQQSIKAYVDATAGHIDRGNRSSNDLDLTGTLNGTAGSWVADIDLSSYITGTGAVTVLLGISLQDGAAGTKLEFKTNGFANDNNSSALVAPVAGTTAFADMIVTTDSDQYIAGKVSASSDVITLIVRGWWTLQ